MSTVIKVTTSNILPDREIKIRDAIKRILREQPMLKDENIKGIHNTMSSSRGWAKPYLYVMYRGRRHVEEETDTANFAYEYLFDIGVVSQLKSMDEDKTEDRLLNILRVAESALSVNEGLLDNTVRFHYAHEIERDDSNFIEGTNHAVIRVEYQADVPLGS